MRSFFSLDEQSVHLDVWSGEFLVGRQMFTAKNQEVRSRNADLCQTFLFPVAGIKKNMLIMESQFCTVSERAACITGETRRSLHCQ